MSQLCDTVNWLRFR